MRRVQHFSVVGDEIWFLRSASHCLCRLTVSEKEFCLERHPINPCNFLVVETPPEYGVAHASGHFLFTGWLERPQLGRGPFENLTVHDFSLPFHNVRPVSATVVRGRFVILCQENFLGPIDSLVTFDPVDETACIRPLDVILGPARKIVWAPDVLRCRDEVAVVLTGEEKRSVLWVDRGQFEVDAVSTSSSSIVGPGASTGILLLEPVHHGIAVLKCIEPEREVRELRRWSDVPWRNAQSVSMTENGAVVIMDWDESLYIQLPNDAAFTQVPPDPYLGKGFRPIKRADPLLKISHEDPELENE